MKMPDVAARQILAIPSLAPLYYGVEPAVGIAEKPEFPFEVVGDDDGPGSLSARSEKNVAAGPNPLFLELDHEWQLRIAWRRASIRKIQSNRFQKAVQGRQGGKDHLF